MTIFLTACTSSLEKGNTLIAADEMKQGPGVFSGKQGAFYLAEGGKSKTSTPKPASKISFEETSITIDKKIEQLDKDRKELERLKHQINTFRSILTDPSSNRACET